MAVHLERSERVIIGIGHKARQGKDTAADYLSEKYGCRIIHFADALYDECTNGEILFKSSPPQLWLKPAGEDYFHYPDPPQNFIQWILENSEQRGGLAFGAELYFGGMKEKSGALLQFWGTEFRRKCFSWDYWVDQVRSVITSNPGDDFLIPDTRFKNEAGMIKSLGGIVWKIDRIGFIANDRDPNHPSETDLDDWVFDEVIHNDGVISGLLGKADALYRRIKEHA
ncbi:hypothetical protein ACFL6I_14985 [candidate division KSB1 bacterium]